MCVCVFLLDSCVSFYHCFHFYSLFPFTASLSPMHFLSLSLVSLIIPLGPVRPSLSSSYFPLPSPLLFHPLYFLSPLPAVPLSSTLHLCHYPCPKFFFTNVVVREWNNLPPSVVQCNTNDSFKNKLDRHFLELSINYYAFQRWTNSVFCRYLLNESLDEYDISTHYLEHPFVIFG